MTADSISPVAIVAHLDRPDGRYLHQETILMVVTLSNSSAAQVAIPYLVQHTFAIELRGDAHGDVRRGDRPFVPPAPLRNMPEPEATLDPHADVTYRLPLDLAIGVVAPGRYHVRMVVTGAPMAFTTPWPPLEVLVPQVAAATSAPSAAIEAGEQRTTWRDDGIMPPVILLQTRSIREPAITVITYRQGNADAGSLPALAEAPASEDPTAAWTAWTADDSLVLARQSGEQVRLFRTRLPHPGLRLRSRLAVSEKPDGTDPILRGVLVSADNQQLVEFAGDGELITFQPAVAAGPGEIVGIATAPIIRDAMALVTVRLTDGHHAIDGWIVGPAQPIIAVPLGSLAGTLTGVDVAWADGEDRARWAIVVGSPDGAGLDIVEGSFTAARGSVPRTHRVPGAAAASTVVPAFDEQRRLWVLCVESGRATIFGPGAEAGIAVALPTGFRYPGLLFRRGTSPQVTGLGDEGRFAALPIALPPARAANANRR